MQYHKYSLSEIEDMMPWEREVYTTFLIQYLEELKQKEEELRSMMQLYGRGGLWNDYIKFCAEARKKREYQKKEREKFIEHMKEVILGIIILLVSIGGVAGIIWFLLAQKAN